MPSIGLQEVKQEPEYWSSTGFLAWFTARCRPTINSGVKEWIE